MLSHFRLSSFVPIRKMGCYTSKCRLAINLDGNNTLVNMLMKGPLSSRQLDLFQFLEDVSHLIEISS